MSKTNLKEALNKVNLQLKEQLPEHVLRDLDDMVANLQEKGIADGIPVGKKAPDFTLYNAVGEQVSLYDELAKGPVVLVFYRGAWCPFCNLQLKSYQEILPEIKAIGAQLIAVSPQTPDNSLTMVEKHNLEFELVSDVKGLISAKYNDLFDVPMNVKSDYLELGIDLSIYNNSDHWVLPVPGNFMIDETGTIRSVYLNPDYSVRQEPEDLLDELSYL